MNLPTIFIGCGKTKLSHPAPARELYTGNLFKQRRAYAERMSAGRPWFILSAKHGLLAPDDVVKPYDLTMADLKPVDRAAWHIAVVHGLLDCADDDDDLSKISFEIHAGADYCHPLAKILELVGFGKVTLPVAHMGIGHQLEWYGRSPASNA